MNVLECSSRGDKRLSTFYAKVKVFDVFDTISNHYHLSKRYLKPDGEILVPKSLEEIPEEAPSFFLVNGREFPTDYLSFYYKLLWTKYLDGHKKLVEYASEFDDFTSSLKSENDLSQAEIIKRYVKEGRESLMKDCEPFLKILRKDSFVMETKKDLLKSREDIIAQQVNCMGVMQEGLAFQIKCDYPNVYKDYNLLCKQYSFKRYLMGRCQLVKVENENRFIANLFGQHDFGTNKMYTEYSYIEKALYSLKEDAKAKNLSVGIPYKMGCDLAGGDWNIVRKIIEKVFNDYPVTIYILPRLR